ncbi:aldo/keto reductase [Verrucomicrobia bacterium S94]|nr:aldo/keto reductase [Verrucomicrobia bacterium S94]
MKRRELLQQMAVAGTVLAPPASMSNTLPSDSLGSVLPRRTLGKTGEEITCLGLGGYHVGWPDDEAVAQATIEKALETGIRFFDTAESYGEGRSEERYGKFLIPKYRDHIFLMTKTGARDAQTAREHLEGSLRRLKTDHIDLWQMHSLDDPADADARLEAGVLEVAMKAREEGKIRHIGFTGHASPYAHIRMTEHKDVLENCSTCQFPINPVDAASRHSFIENTLPVLQKNRFGVLAMKTLADGRFFGRKVMNGKTMWTLDKPVVPDVLSIEECIHFALSLPVSVLITGAENPQLVEEKAAMVRNFSHLSGEQRLALSDKVAAFAAAGKVEYYKNDDLRT